MRVLGKIFVVAVLLLAGRPAYANPCSCRPEIPADSTGPGTCRKVQDGSQFCKLDWDAGGNSSESGRVMNELRKRGFKSDFDGDTAIEQAARSLFDPGKTTASAMSVLMAASLLLYAPERLPLAEAFGARYSDPRFGASLMEPQSRIERDKLSAGNRNYEIVLAFGCAQARDGAFFLMIKTRFAVQRGNCDEDSR
jgi:hypothetical protein